MKIGYDAKRFMQNFRGLGNYSRSLITGINKLHPDWQLNLYCPKINPQFVKLLNENVSIITPENKLDQLFSSLWRINKIASLVSSDRCDIYHGLSHELPKLNPKNKNKFIKIVTIHDLLFLRYPDNFPWIDRQSYFYKYQYAVKNADLIIAICQQTKNDIISTFNISENKIKVHYQSCDPQFFVKYSSDDKEKIQQKYNLTKPFILSVGAFEANKNKKNTILSFLKIAHQIPHDLVLIGNTNNKKNLSELHEIIAQNPRIKILLSVDFFDLPKIYQSSDATCFPSFFEGFGIPNLESLAAGVPVITSFGSSMAESAGPSSYFVDPYSIDSISEGMLKVLSDNNLRNKMITDGNDYVLNFTPEVSSIKLSEIYRSMLKY